MDTKNDVTTTQITSSGLDPDLFNTIAMLSHLCYLAQAKDSDHVVFINTRDPKARNSASVSVEYVSAIRDIFGSENAQHLNCSCCKKFIQTSGAIATISDDGNVRESLFWNLEAVSPAEMQQAGVTLTDELVAFFGRMNRAVNKTTLRGPLRECDVGNVGVVEFGGHKHLHANISTAFYHAPPKLGMGRVKPWQTVLDQVRLTLEDPAYTSEAFKKAAGLLHRTKNGDRYVAIMKFSLWNRLIRSHAEKKLSNARLWFVILTNTPTGASWYNIRSSSISTVFTRLAAGASDSAIIKECDTILDPLNHMRATTEANEFALELADEYFQEKGLYPSFERRLMTAEEGKEWFSVWARNDTPVETVVAEEEPADPKKGASAAAAMAALMGKKREERKRTLKSYVSDNTDADWKNAFRALEKKSVMDDLIKCIKTHGARRIRLAAESVSISGERMPFAVCIPTTATNPEAPPIFHWDKPEHRFPTSLIFPIERIGGSAFQEPRNVGRLWSDMFDHTAWRDVGMIDITGIGLFGGPEMTDEIAATMIRCGIHARYFLGFDGVSMDWMKENGAGIGLFATCLNQDISGDPQIRRIIENLSARSEFSNLEKGGEYLAGIAVSETLDGSHYKIAVEGDDQVIRAFTIIGAP